MSATFASPFGPLSLRDDGARLTALVWGEGGAEATPLQAEGLRQLAAFFERRLTRFDLPLDWGTGLHEKVRRAMAAIPLGETRRYGEIAADVGAPAQAVGQACGANPLPILIPCHRVLGAKGLGGFSAPGGVETKVALLRFEGAAGLLI
ncbi:methylated-DNA--[protein]-cysteine S-methyltransferase [Pseudogemmobacter humi]|uniref:Methylated-DNA--protein-cysteine methyltransferase n=1 Tax=Pseudogemmobacter humi TaxID=2483812 RepID=A0A3P5X1R9_9RHOB|nr:Methylated-DNA--protein-cysteine methyltransferase [Pseudogemmobacter humi]